MLTRVPAAAEPSVVSDRVSRETSAANAWSLELRRGQAGAAHCDAAADLHVVERDAARLDPERDVAAARLDRTDAAHALHDAGEHQPSSLRRGRSVSRRSSPTRSTSRHSNSQRSHMRSSAGMLKRLRAADAEHDGRHVDHHFVDEARAQELRPRASGRPRPAPRCTRAPRGARAPRPRSSPPAPSGTPSTGHPPRAAARRAATSASRVRISVGPANRQHVRRRRRAQRGVEHDPERTPSAQLEARVARGEQRVVGDDRAAARDDRGGARAQPLHVGARRLARDPLAGAVGERRAAVEARAELERDPGTAARHAAHEAAIEFRRLVRQQAHGRRDARGRETREAAAVHRGVRVAHGDDYPRHTGRDERIHAGRRAPVVRTGLERHVGRGAGRRGAGVLERDDLGVRRRPRARGSPRRPPGPSARARSRRPGWAASNRGPTRRVPARAA